MPKILFVQTLIPNLHDPDGATSLMIAVLNGNDIELIQMLVSHGANVVATDNIGNNAVHFLGLTGNPASEIISRLLLIFCLSSVLVSMQN